MTADGEIPRGRRQDAARRERRLEAARDAYRERFGEDAPVSLYLGHPRWPDVLMQAAEDGKPLTPGTLADQLGGKRLGRWGEP
jgi:hypothetical protein